MQEPQKDITMNGQFTRNLAQSEGDPADDRTQYRLGKQKAACEEECHGNGVSESCQAVPLPAARMSCDLGVGCGNRDRSRRRLAFLKRSGLFGESKDGITISRASSLDELRGAYRLVHDVYIKAGYIIPERSKLRIRIFETSPETATFIARKDGQIVGVLTIVGDSTGLGLPSDIAFKSELDSLRAKGLRLSEATNQVVAEQFRSSALTTELIRCAVAHASKAGYDELIAAVSPSHESFCRLLNFQFIGSVRSYSEEIHDPVIALSMDLNHFRQMFEGSDEVAQYVHSYMSESNPFMQVVSRWDLNARREFLKESLLRHLFVTETEFITRCSNTELHALELAWGQGLFARVTGVSLFTKALKWMEALLSVTNMHDDHPWLPDPVRLPH